MNKLSHAVAGLVLAFFLSSFAHAQDLPTLTTPISGPDAGCGKLYAQIKPEMDRLHAFVNYTGNLADALRANERAQYLNDRLTDCIAAQNHADDDFFESATGQLEAASIDIQIRAEILAAYRINHPVRYWWHHNWLARHMASDP